MLIQLRRDGTNAEQWQNAHSCARWTNNQRKTDGGVVFCSTTNEYGMKRDGASCFDINASGPIFKENILARVRRPFFSSFLRPFSRKTTFLFLHTKIAHLPVPVGLFRPIHKPSQLQHKIGIKPTSGNPPEHDATKPRLHMTPHPLLHTRT